MTATTATAGGNVTEDGCLPITARGICWNTTGNPTLADNFTTDGTGTGAYISTMTGLSLEIRYYYRTYATNSKGTNYGEEKFFMLGVVDFDGNYYNTVVIGTQTWFKENLKTTHYANGDPITLETTSAWVGKTTEAYCWLYHDYATYGSVYGAFYNLYATTDARNICPLGWHVPSKVEWTVLTDYLGGLTSAAAKMKETGTIHWNTNNGTNESGFTALAAGQRSSSADSFTYFKNTAIFASSTLGWHFELIDNIIWYNTPNWGGFSVRCVRDTK